ncbi:MULTISPECIES: hypothetical protein [unclassified Nonomuraea]|uniref:hypothetical protein n=1 Tax=unclassified Nonomuraea TaxID=2593643 RepID=UPI0033F4259E
MDDNALFGPPAADMEMTRLPHGWTTVNRTKVKAIIKDEFVAADPIIRPGQRDFFPRKATYQWEWRPDHGWRLTMYVLTGPNRKANGEVGLMTVTERRYSAASESWAHLPDWLYLAMVASRPDWEPPAATLQPAEGAVEAVMAAAGDEYPGGVRADDLESGRTW